jgi:hypothetical protein
MVALCDSLIEMKKRDKNILMTTRLLKALRSFYSDDRRSWKCRALQSFFVIDLSDPINPSILGKLKIPRIQQLPPSI